MIQSSKRHRLCERGSAALEAALIFPVAIFLIMACMELYQYYRAAALLDRVAFTVADGVAMQREIFDQGQCDKSNDICVYGTMAEDLFRPLDYSRRGGLIISAYAASEPDTNNNVVWNAQPEWHATFKGPGSTQPAPVSKLTDKSQFPPAKVGDTIIVAEAYYDHEPFAMSSTMWTALAGTSHMYSRFFFRPRFDELRVLH